MRRFAVAMKISRRNNNKPPKKATMAATKKSATGTEASKPTKAPTNSVAMTAHTNSAVTVQSVIIATLFVGAFVGFDASVPVALFFVAAMVAFFGGLLSFLREIFIATANLRI